MIRESLAAYNRRDFDSVVRNFDDRMTFEFVGPIGGAADPVHHGPDGFLRFAADIEEHFEMFRLETSDFRDGASAVFCEVRMLGRGKGSGVDTENLTYCATEFRDGRIVRIRYFLDRAEALEAAGLSE